MRIAPLALVITVVTACGGDGGKLADTAAASGNGGDATASAGATSTAPIGNATPKAATGKTVDVQMIGDAQGYRFVPANVTVKAGDAVRYTMVSGGPHNVTFWADSMPAGTAAQVAANMPNATAPLAGPLLINQNATYVVSFAGTKPGVYRYYCTPHLALGMKAAVTVQ